MIPVAVRAHELVTLMTVTVYVDTAFLRVKTRLTTRVKIFVTCHVTIINTVCHPEMKQIWLNASHGLLHNWYFIHSVFLKYVNLYMVPFYNINASMLTKF